MNCDLEPSWNLYLEPWNILDPCLLGTSEPSEKEPWNLLDPLLGTRTWKLGTFRKFYSEPLLGTLEPPGSLTWNPYLEPRNLTEPCGMTAKARAQFPKAFSCWAVGEKTTDNYNIHILLMSVVYSCSKCV